MAKKDGWIRNHRTPCAFRPLLEPSRYKGAYGGRGSGKSHFFAELLIEDCLSQRGMLGVCIREVQKSLKDSSKRLIETKLKELGLGEADGFRIFEKHTPTRWAFMLCAGPACRRILVWKPACLLYGSMKVTTDTPPRFWPVWLTR